MTRDDLIPLYDLDAPFTTVVLAAPSATENAAEQLRIRWKNTRSALDDAGVHGEVLDELEQVLGEHHERGRSLAAVASEKQVALVRGLPTAAEDTVVTGAALPHLVPLIAADQRGVPHVMIEIDRQGAEVWSHGEGDDADRRSHFEGERLHVHRGHPGGWSQRRFQQRAENTWEDNAKSAARIVVREAERVGAAFVAVAGDVRAKAFLREHLPDRIDALVVELEHGPDGSAGSGAEVASEVATIVADRVARRHTELLRKFDEERGQHDRAADGPARTLEALAQARVETLLVGHDAPGRPAWFGTEPTQVGLDEQAVRAAGAGDPRQGDLVDVAVRAALLTGARVEVMPGPAAHGPDGIGAILRY